ncbi:hypothetical protein [Haloflavibacter putidus]|uniref:DUF2946 domain-containing protein n=1 Tax=Haloflavibacter putidus TaxID=2576776 RepID=A0A507ZTD0_9FLAO|nr:hypothetical protein [Haloflavibacter putidus]TQD40669.1 hypothetical protein FKR84_01425 [Haloflavibacter putidus]
MLSKKVKHSISFIFLFAFLLVEVADLHVLAHDDDDNSTPEKCVWCQISHTQADLTAVLPSASAEISSPIFFEQVYLQPVYSYALSNKLPVCSLYNKPPPTSV